MTSSWSPAARPRSPSDAHGCTSSQASGAPSEPCFGAFPRSFSTERMDPIGRNHTRVGPTDDLARAVIPRALSRRRGSLAASGKATSIRCMAPGDRRLPVGAGSARDQRASAAVARSGVRLRNPGASRCRWSCVRCTAGLRGKSHCVASGDRTVPQWGKTQKRWRRADADVMRAMPS